MPLNECYIYLVLFIALKFCVKDTWLLCQHRFGWQLDAACLLLSLLFDLFALLYEAMDLMRLTNNLISMFSCILCMTLIKFCSFYLLVARCQSDADEDVDTTEESNDIGIVGDDVQDFGDGSFTAAPGIDTICVFPKNIARCNSHSV